MSSFCDYVIFSVTILGPHIDYGGYLSARHDSPDIDLIFMVYWLKFTSSFRNWVSFSITIYNIGSPYLAHKLIDDGGCICVTLPWFSLFTEKYFTQTICKGLVRHRWFFLEETCLHVCPPNDIFLEFNDLRQVSGFLRVLRFPHLKVTLNTITLTLE